MTDPTPQIVAAWTMYYEAVENYAKAEFLSLVKPYLDKHEILFRQCNHEWWLVQEGGCVYRTASLQPGFDVTDLLQDEVGKAIIALLDSEVTGFPHLCLANFMPPLGF